MDLLKLSDKVEWDGQHGQALGARMWTPAQNMTGSNITAFVSSAAPATYTSASAV